MAKILLEINNHKEFKKGDMLIFDGKTFISIDKEHILSDIPGIKEDIKKLNERLNIAEASIKYDHGEITEEEYNKVCGLNK